MLTASNLLKEPHLKKPETSCTEQKMFLIMILYMGSWYSDSQCASGDTLKYDMNVWYVSVALGYHQIIYLSFTKAFPPIEFTLVCNFSLPVGKKFFPWI